MKKLFVSMAAAAALAFTTSANAVTITNEVFAGDVAQYQAPDPTNPPAPVNFEQTSGTIANQTLSPYFFNSNYSGTAEFWQYDVLSKASVGAGSVTFNLQDPNVLVFLWGSPDDYNSITFYDGLGGTGSAVGSFTGASLACYGVSCTHTGFDLVTFNVAGALSMTLLDSGQAAFEFGFNPVPLPATLPLFASGLGALGIAGWRKRKKAKLAA